LSHNPPFDDKDLIYEGIATVAPLTNTHRSGRDDKDLIYEGIATRRGSLK